MTTMYLSLTDAAAVAERERLHAVPYSDDPAAEWHDAVKRWATMPTTVQAECVSCGRSHDRLWLIYRRAYDSGLYWPFVNLNGKRELLDSSLPTTVDRLPRDARPVDPAESARLWHEDNESHTFGGPNIAAALRASIAAANGR